MGFRFSEAFGLEPSRADFENRGYWLPGDLTNNGADEFMPAPPQAMKLLRWLHAPPFVLARGA